MADSTLSLTRNDFRRYMAHYLGYGRDSEKWSLDQKADLDDLVPSGERQFYHPPLLPGQDLDDAHEWSWMYPIRSFKVFAAVTGTLKGIPKIDGDSRIFEINEDTFLADHAGVTKIKHTDTGRTFDVIGFVNGSKVRAVGDGNSKFGEPIATRVVDSANVTSSITKVTATTSIFREDMVGDNLVAGATYTIISVGSGTTSTTCYVEGNASGESGGFTIQKTATVIVLIAFGFNTLVKVDEANTFRQDMADDSDTITFGTAPNNVFTINTFRFPDQVLVTGSAFDTESNTDTITIKKSGTISGTPANTARSTLVYTEPLPVTEDLVGLQIAFVVTELISSPPREPTGSGRTLRGSKIATTERVQSIRTYEILAVDTKNNSFDLDGDSTRDIGDTFDIVQTSGQVTGELVFSGASTTLNATAAVFTSSIVAGMVIKFASSGNTYAISSKTDTDTVVLAGNAGRELGGDRFTVLGISDFAADDAITLLGTGSKYDLPDDFGAVEGQFTFAANEAFAAIDVINEGQIRVLQQQSAAATARPKYAAVRPKKMPQNSTQTGGQRFEVDFWPAPDSTYNLTYKYMIQPEAMSDDAPYPLGGAVHAETLLQSGLCVAELHKNDEKGVHWDRFMERLGASIAQDRKATTPEFLGYNGDGSDSNSRWVRRSDLRRWDLNATVTVGGVTPT